MKVYLNLQTAALILHYIAFSNFHVLEFPQIFFLKLFFQIGRTFMAFIFFGTVTLHYHWLRRFCVRCYPLTEVYLKNTKFRV